MTKRPHRCLWLRGCTTSSKIPRLMSKYINDEFGSEVAEIVRRVTDEPGKNRRERKQATYQKTKQSPAAVTLKLADRIANVAASKANNPGLFQMYAKEYSEFQNQLYQESSNELTRNLWQELNRYFE